MSVTAAKKEYLASKYHGIELNLKRRVEQASNPFWGGTFTGIATMLNSVVRPFKVTKGLFIGSNVDPEAVQRLAEVPKDLAHTMLGENLEKSRELERSAAKQRAEAIGDFCWLDFSGGFRKMRAADHEQAHEHKTVMVDDKHNALVSTGITALGASLHMGLPVLLKAANGNAGQLGNLSPSAMPIDTMAMLMPSGLSGAM